VDDPRLAPILLYQDDHLLAVAKPAGDPVIPSGGGPREACLHGRLEAAIGARLWVVHRLDRDASGVMVFARHAEAHRALSQAFEHRRVEKHYVAYTFGALVPAEGRLDIALHEARRGKTRPAAAGEAGAREATTEYRIRRCWQRDEHRVSLVNLRPVTGRHHQLRVHLRALGAPILFDALYGRGIPRQVFADAPCARLALHARRLVLPAIGRMDSRPDDRLVIEAPIPPDLVSLGRWLNAGWRVEPESA
jgi:tRNA pseudouridine32 synthase / 23S rRNA pseudouridine746 synthase